MYLCVCAVTVRMVSFCERMTGAISLTYHPRSVQVRRESAFLRRYERTFIYQSPIHKIISLMITSRAQCNDKWALQRAPLMKQRETLSDGAPLVGLSYTLCETWNCIFLTLLLYTMFMHLFNCVCLSVDCWCLNEWTGIQPGISIGLPAS